MSHWRTTPSHTHKHHGAGGQPNQGANEGEGNRTAARNYDRAQEAFANSGQVDQKAAEARRAIDGSEGESLARAEKKGKAGDPMHTGAKPMDKGSAAKH